MIQTGQRLEAQDLLPAIQRLWDVSAPKIRSIEAGYVPANGTPVFTVRGRYTARGWTEWTQGFQFGSAILQFDATGEREFLESGRRSTVELMAPHVSHIGVHDHGFNNVSTYGNLWRLMREGRLEGCQAERDFYEIALKCSAAVQAARWTRINGGGFIYSFNGPHSLFVDTMRSLRSLSVGHQLGHALMEENDRRVSLLHRLIQHARATAVHGIWYGEGKGTYDVRGRTAHESIFNTNDGNYRCPSTQQGYSPHSTWTRGLAWAMCGFAEQLEFFRTVPHSDFEAEGGRQEVERAVPPRGRGHLRFLYRQHSRGWSPLLGHRSAGSEPDGRLPRPSRGSVQRLGACRQFRRRDRRARTSAARALSRQHAILARGTHGAGHPVGRALPEQ